MPLFFDDLDTLCRFTHEIEQHTDLQCRHCQQRSQFVSHGCVYQKQHHRDPQCVGKRLRCSNRHGKTGCGRTVRLYLATHIPRLHYTATCCFAFCQALLKGERVATAYRRATGCQEARNAFRWLQKLERQQLHHRRRLIRPDHVPTTIRPGHSRRHALIFSTLHAIFNSPSCTTCTAFQQHHQTAFF